MSKIYDKYLPLVKLRIALSELGEIELSYGFSKQAIGAMRKTYNES